MSETGKLVQLRSGHAIASPGEPDAEVVTELEDLLERAKSGQISGLAYSYTYSDGATGNRYVGVISRSQVGGLFAVMSRISRQLDDC